MLLEKMDEFFGSRAVGYDEHMLRDIEGAAEFYPYTASLLPKCGTILDLGCGTGLELEEYFAHGGSAEIVGIDLSDVMLGKLREKLGDKQLSLICGSYFDVPFGDERYSAAVSVESLHHFKPEEKRKLYKKLHDSLADGGYFILTDYFAESVELEGVYFRELERLKREQGIHDGEFYHYDTPLTVEHECEILSECGFSSVSLIKSWAATSLVKAVK